MCIFAPDRAYESTCSFFIKQYSICPVFFVVSRQPESEMHLPTLLFLVCIFYCFWADIKSAYFSLVEALIWAVDRIF